MRTSSWRVVRAVSLYVLLTAGALLMLLPVLWMVSASFMGKDDIVSSPVNLLPPSWRWHNYAEIFTLFDIGHYLMNSVVVTGTVIVLNVVFCTMTGYSLAKFRYPGRNLVFGFVLATFMIPFTVIAIPLYLLVRSLDWIDSYQGLIAPFALTAFGVFLMRQFIAAIPDEYIEAARIDGASEAYIFVRIVAPQCRPAIATLAVLTFVTNWDEFLWPLIVTTTDQHRTITIGLAHFLEQHQNQWHLLMAGAVVAAVPSVLLFLVAQKKFLESAGGISGIK